MLYRCPRQRLHPQKYIYTAPSAAKILIRVSVFNFIINCFIRYYTSIICQSIILDVLSSVAPMLPCTTPRVTATKYILRVTCIHNLKIHLFITIKFDFKLTLIILENIVLKCPNRVWKSLKYEVVPG